jgi:hypothetical protein
VSRGSSRAATGIFAAADVAEHEMTERNFVHRLGQHQVAAQQARDCLAMVLRDRRIQAQCVVAGRVPLPAER